MKKELRIKYKEIRNNVLDKDKKSIIISNKILNSIFYKESNKIALYSSFSSEVDTNYLIKECLKDKKNIYLPRVIDKENMKFYKINSIDELTFISKFGIKEPDMDLEENDFDLVVIPGICFDTYKNRIGYGKGYYDKFFQNKNVLKVAICFDEQIYNDVIPTNDNDIKMDLIITDKNIY